jgi:hypothetical protein
MQMTSRRTIVLTGASGMLGRVLLAHLLQAGYDIVATTHRADSAVLLRQEQSAASVGQLRIWSGDLIAPDGATALIDFIEKNGAHPYALINNARNVGMLQTEEDGHVKRENFVGEFMLDVVAPYELTMALAKSGRSALKRVVNIASMYGVVAANPTLYEDPIHQSPIHYSIAKAGLIHLTKELAVRLADRQICVNAVSFGGVEGRSDPVFISRYARLSPTGRMLRESEIIAPITFLLSDGASGVTGHNLVVDGGWTVW